MDLEAAQRAIAQFLDALGHPAEGERAQTPELVVQAWSRELLSGYARDPAQILREAAIARDGKEQEWVVLRDLEVVTMCPHHLLPAHGRADVVYRPGPRLVGFGAVARALDALGRRLTLQETLGRSLTALLEQELGAEGALCRLRMTHTCLVTRGARQHGALVETLAFAGSFAQEPERQSALAALGGGGR